MSNKSPKTPDELFEDPFSGGRISFPFEETITWGRLKELLKDIPDETIVVMEDSEYDHSGIVDIVKVKYWEENSDGGRKYGLVLPDLSWDELVELDEVDPTDFVNKDDWEDYVSDDEQFEASVPAIMLVMGQ